jgi:hypothetical protein
MSRRKWKTARERNASKDEAVAMARGFQHALSLDIPSIAMNRTVGAVTWQAFISGMLSFERRTSCSGSSSA